MEGKYHIIGKKVEKQGKMGETSINFQNFSVRFSAIMGVVDPNSDALSVIENKIKEKSDAWS